MNNKKKPISEKSYTDVNEILRESNFVGFFDQLIEIDQFLKDNQKNNENNGNTDNTN